MRMLITGAAGQLGRQAASYFANGYDIISLSSNDLDISDKNAVRSAFDAYNPDICLNCAAMNAVDHAETPEGKALAYKVNRDGTANLAETCRQLDALLVHISTDYVFDGAKDSEYTETAETGPLNVYGKSKLAGEVAAISSGCRLFIARTSWLYGHGRTHFLNTMLKLGKESGIRSGNEKESRSGSGSSSARGSVSVVTDQRGSPTTCLELCRQIQAIIKSAQYGIYHTSCEGACTWNEFAREIFKLYGLDTEVKDIVSDEFARPARRPANSTLSKRKLTDVTGYFPKSWRECLIEYFEGDTVYGNK